MGTDKRPRRTFSATIDLAYADRVASNEHRYKFTDMVVERRSTHAKLEG